MIRDCKPEDIDALVGIWLDAAIVAHGFIAADYWRGKSDAMRKTYLPSAEILVCHEDGSESLPGFITLVDSHIAALFVSPTAPDKGIGMRLLDRVKTIHDRLGPSVYKANAASIAFYAQRGFQIVGDGIDDQTGHDEWHILFVNH